MKYVEVVDEDGYHIAFGVIRGVSRDGEYIFIVTTRKEQLRVKKDMVKEIKREG